MNAAGFGSPGRSGGYFVGLFGTFDIDDPVACQKLLGLGKDSISDGLAGVVGADEFRLIGEGEAFGCYEDSSSFSCLLNVRMKAMLASRSCFGHLA